MVKNRNRQGKNNFQRNLAQRILEKRSQKSAEFTPSPSRRIKQKTRTINSEPFTSGKQTNRKSNDKVFKEQPVVTQAINSEPLTTGEEIVDVFISTHVQKTSQPIVDKKIDKNSLPIPPKISNQIPGKIPKLLRQPKVKNHLLNQSVDRLEFGNQDNACTAQKPVNIRTKRKTRTTEENGRENQRPSDRNNSRYSANDCTDSNKSGSK